MRGTDFAELAAFVAVADRRSFAKAAAHLGIAPSTLSQTIRSLEERLGVRLLNRTTRSVSPTEAGERLLADLQPALSDIGKAVEGINAFRDKPMGALRVSMMRSAATSLVAPLISPFIAAFPEITLELAIDDTHSDIVRDGFDAGIRIGERIEKDMIAVRIFDASRLVLVASPAYLDGRPLPQAPQDLQSHNCIRARRVWDNAIQPWLLEKDDQTVEVQVGGTLIVNDLELERDLVRDGCGIGYLPEPLVAEPLLRGHLVQVLEDWSLGFSGLFLYYSSRRQVPAPLQAFVDFLKEKSRVTRQEYAELMKSRQHRQQPALRAPDRETLRGS